MRRNVDEKLRIELFELSHSEALFKLIQSNRDHFGKWLEFPHHTHTVNDTRAFIARTIQKQASGNGGWCGIWQEHQLIGAIGLVQINRKDQTTEIGYYLAQEYEGKGIIIRSCREVIKYIFEELALHRIELRVHPDNARSRKIPERLGFVQEGILRQAEWFIDRYIDKVIYGLLKEEWNPGI
ncbi:GNAT family protein [Paenibacillus phoenicis]|uniref:GNAT family protein n=1 Tax=Paenibacillus phoenicis TaxID=554117 RepID=A0ABU5PGV9_9BACL|nr:MULTISPECIES: GNAT family protein [Paenibacillus]MCT2196265.1 GNAT family N-acetyltransferase [Paenibacillus sp. p3-SID1389]MEA3569110.1 GNAT family protein [Paenibacillus phoenicis]